MSKRAYVVRETFIKTVIVDEDAFKGQNILEVIDEEAYRNDDFIVDTFEGYDITVSDRWPEGKIPDGEVLYGYYILDENGLSVSK